MGLRRRKKQLDQMVQLHEEMMARQREELERRAAAQRQQSGGRALPQERPRQTVRSPGWYPDEQQPGYVRWWNGSAWTDNTRPA